MAGYFSNHSAPQSRFLANKDKEASSTPPAAMPQRPRIPSKHFSTSVSGDERTIPKDKPAALASATPPVHPLRNTWVFWFRQHRAPGNKIVNYEEGIKKIASCSSVESFWSLWTHLHPPSALLPTTDYLLFHAAIRRPVWEDPLNLDGGKWIIRLRKGLADRIWEDLVLALVGDMFAACAPDDDAGSWRARGGARAEGEDVPEICGATISVRQNEDIVSVWNRVEADMKVRERIKDTIRRVLNLPPNTIMEYKSNNASLQHVDSAEKSRTVSGGNHDRTALS